MVSIRAILRILRQILWPAKAGWARKTLRVLVALVLILWFGASWAISPFIRSRLELAVAQNLNAHLRIGHLRYYPPLRVVASDVQLIANGDPTDQPLLSMSGLELTLAGLPHKGQPLLIQSVSISGLSVHLERQNTGSIGPAGGLVRHSLTKPATEPSAAKMGLRPSDVVQLRHLHIDHGMVQLVDHTRPESPPMRWENITLDSTLAQATAKEYTVRLSAGQQPSADLSFDATIDVDDGLLTIQKLGLNATLDSAQASSQFPPAVQSVLSNLGVRGALSATATGNVPLTNLAASQLTLVTSIKNGAAMGISAGVPLDDVSFDLATTLSEQKISTAIQSLKATAGHVAVAMAPGAVVSIDSRQGTWSVANFQGDVTLTSDAAGDLPPLRIHPRLLEGRGQVAFSGTVSGPLPAVGAPTGAAYLNAVDGQILLVPRDGLALGLPSFPSWLTNIHGGPVVLNGQAIAVSKVSARYGNDSLRLDNATVPMADASRGLIKIQDIVGAVLFQPPSPPYPQIINSTIARLRPGGEYTVDGFVTVDRTGARPTTDLGLWVRTFGGRMTVTDLQIPLERIRANARITPARVALRDLACNVAGGTMQGSASIGLIQTIHFDASVQLDRIDLKQLAQVLKLDDPNGKLAGSGRAKANLRGDGRPDFGEFTDALAGDGTAQVFDGNFFQISFFRDIADMAHVGKDAVTVGKIDSAFTIGQSAVTFSKLNVSSSTVGVQGTGVVKFDQTLDFNVVVAPLADWKAKLQKTGVPVVSNVVGEVAGGLQKLINGATGLLLYSYRITGTIHDPKETVVPAPVVTDNMAKVFAEMLGGGDHK